MRYALDSNILVYAYNLDSPFNPKLSQFLEEKILTGKIKACLPYQSLYEFYAVITDAKRVEKPLVREEAFKVLEIYEKTKNIPKIFPRKSNLKNVLELLKAYPLGKQGIFDLVLVATLLDNEVEGIITLDTAPFDKFKFLKVLNPLT